MTPTVRTVAVGRRRDVPGPRDGGDEAARHGPVTVATTATLAAGDPIGVVDRPAHGVTVAGVFAIFHHERDRAARLLEAPGRPARYHDWTRERLARA